MCIISLFLDTLPPLFTELRFPLSVIILFILFEWRHDTDTRRLIEKGLPNACSSHSEAMLRGRCSPGLLWGWQGLKHWHCFPLFSQEGQQGAGRVDTAWNAHTPTPSTRSKAQLPANTFLGRQKIMNGWSSWILGSLLTTQNTKIQFPLAWPSPNHYRLLGREQAQGLNHSLPFKQINQ